MTWLAQNWIWIVLAVGVFLLMRRAGCGMGHMGGGGGHAHGGGHEPSGGAYPPTLERHEARAAVDPVSRRELPAGGSPVSAVYRGRAYYFENRENREAFEKEPEKYAGGAESGAPLEQSSREHSHRRRHGC